MGVSIRARLSGMIVRFLEPQIQGIITDRILLFRKGLIRDGVMIDKRKPWPESLD